ncbi:hypothetical protein EI42_01725 [Thermosporothrix hazakensis]|uniref:Uncharacterized protein n=1 Tax=Thermosporothrix hazakensis TaxID=644383 RepID=A0A326UJF5_THEHA|nr:hypothetical protein [Thermosporothrix hazakensis]PZW32633.1 hypothetical protein EI42_01725 [Thermosporothrix hazakensis]GCE49986.1 hypothetical protein KTH_48550 [Thermosporothrix hazakensis]
MNVNWLDITFKEYTRLPDKVRARLAVQGFQAMLREHVFTEENWELVRCPAPDTMFWKGSFPNTTRKAFPDRLLQVRLVDNQEQLYGDSSIEEDLLLIFQLLHLDGQLQRGSKEYKGYVEFEGKNILFSLNMSYSDTKKHYDDIPFPMSMTPYSFLSLYAYLEEKFQAGYIPEMEQGTIRSDIQPALLDHAIALLLNAELGAAFRMNGIRLIEEVIRRQLQKHYSQYQTLMTNGYWKQSLKKYQHALWNLPTFAMRQGKELYSATRQELAAEIFHIAVPPLENFLYTNRLLVREEEKEQWRFTLHPLEKQILTLVKPYYVDGREKAAIEALVKTQGYRTEEFEEALVLMQIRGLISVSSDGNVLFPELETLPEQPAMQAERERFDRVHAAWKALLLQQTRDMDAWQDISFQPAAVQKSYTALGKQVQKVLLQEVDALQQEVQEARERCIHLMEEGPHNIPLPGGSFIQQNLEAFWEHLSQTMEQLKGWEQQLSDARFLRMIRAEGTTQSPDATIETLLFGLNSLRQWLTESVDTLLSYEERLAAVRLTTQEKELLATVNNLLYSAEGSMELGQLLQCLERHSISLQDIIQLYEKRRLSITVSLPASEEKGSYGTREAI